MLLIPSAMTVGTAQISELRDPFGPTVVLLKRKYPSPAETNSDHRDSLPGPRQIVNHSLRIQLPSFAIRIRTKTAFMFASSDAGREMVTQLSARQSKRLCRHQHGRSESAATDLLAVTAMAFQHHDRLCSALVTNRTADAAAGERYFHGSRVIGSRA